MDPTFAEQLDLVLRLLLAAVLGAIIGLEREIHEHPAGMRTHLLVSLGSLVGGQVLGKTQTTGLTVFVVSVDASGNVTLDQQRAAVHTNPNDPDDETIGTGGAIGDCGRS